MAMGRIFFLSIKIFSDSEKGSYIYVTYDITFVHRKNLFSHLQLKVGLKHIMLQGTDVQHIAKSMIMGKSA